MKYDYQPEFNLIDELIHLNHAAIAPWPARTREAVISFATENNSQGSLNYPQWMEKESSLREQLRQLINAQSTDEIALLKSTSEALSVVAYGIDWRPGDSVVTSAEEFPSNRLLWESLKQYGVNVKLVNYSTDEDAEQAVINATDATTRLVSISAVQYASGRRIDLKRIGAHCRQQQILFCVDAIQQLGALAFDVEEIQADFVAADGHKWMLGPEGMALFYCRREHIKSLKLHQYGWHMVAKMHDFNATQWQPADTARRFECGSPNMLGIMALSASLSLLLDIGIDEIEKKVLDNTRFIITALSANKSVTILSSTGAEQLSGIVTFRHNTIDNDELFEYLKENRVFCALRGGGIRISPHFYTPKEKLQQLVDLIDKLES